MNTGSINLELRNIPVVAYRWGNPFQFKQTSDAEMMLKHRDRGPSGKGPLRPSRETRVIIATVVGIVLCCTIGVIIGASLAGFGGVFIGLVGGMLIGGIGGSYVGELLRRRHLRKLDRKENPDKTDQNSQGPFIK
ncbi:MAG: hypothetical protein JSU79_07955 [Dehalococcoidales bacterium]|nr:MAG: hypothetical protein JSU79_07955 [Dehalococcoidales bacterium]